MITINTDFVGTAEMTDRPVASACMLGLSGSAFPGSGLSGLSAVRPSSFVAAFPVVEGFEADERPVEALEAAAAQAPVYALAATGAGQTKQTKQHLTMWAFRGLEPWSDPA
ncbi:hypothetical protein LUX12_07545 [Streptomyces somaliensis]|uniref:hypothetical protein n=1 Tax=Streptomyces somaliensis TaxID=78355 RepID=UPI0020CCE4FD|nr:hypothetical protein [Streptomyces somaliensis]MCP9944666.1 hypothetical protein [Streptomyces somaliensis]MCP9974924.1 hypothetical protein [Streptomyces somaliensis]